MTVGSWVALAVGGGAPAWKVGISRVPCHPLLRELPLGSLEKMLETKSSPYSTNFSSSLFREGTDWVLPSSLWNPPEDIH